MMVQERVTRNYLRLLQVMVLVGLLWLCLVESEEVFIPRQQM